MDSSLQVTLVGDYPPPHGGVAVHVAQLLSAFRGRSVPVRVLDIGKGGRPDPDVLPVRTGAKLLSAAWQYGRRGVLHLHTSGNNAKAFMVAGAVGTVGAGGFGLGAGAIGARVITLHSGLLPAFLRASLQHRILARAALMPYSAIVAVSAAVRDALIEIGIQPQRITVIPAFCSSQVIPGEVPPRTMDVLRRRAPLLVMAHHPSKVYGRALVFDALARVARVYPFAGLAMFGPGTASAEVRADAERFGVASRLEDFGELEHGQALALIQRASAFIRPTTADGDSISVREALTLGVRCIASDVCDRPEGTRTFRAGDAQALCDAVLSALDAPPQVVRQPDASVALEALYRRLLAEPGAPAIAPAVHG